MKYLKEKNKRYVIIPKLLGLKTNVIDFIPYFSLGAFMHKTYEEDTEVNLTFKVVKYIDKPKELNKKLENFWGEDNIPKVFYEKIFSNKIKFQLLINKIGNNFEFICNKNYIKYCPFRIDRMYPPGGHLQNSAIFSLAEIGCSVLHCSCISRDNDGILIVASSNTGKSLTSFLSIKRGYKFISEDMVVLKDNYAYSAPLISYRSCYENFERKDRIIKKNKKILDEIIDILKLFLSLFKIFKFKKVPSSERFDNFINSNKVMKRVNIKKIIILEKGGNGIKKLDKRECLRKILILNRGEFTYFHDTFLRAMSYFNVNININKIIQEEEKNIKNVIENSDCYLFKSDNPFKFIDYLDEI
ncbi:MAG: hypothetical protein PHS07_01250 [Patescibacteria group bacterium]|nr:hypothetical protein [Patescibacteria group bacterium]